MMIGCLAGAVRRARPCLSLARLRRAAGWLAPVMLLAMPATAGIEDMTDGERAAFRAEVRAYLLDNPEVLMEAIAELERRQADEQADRQGDAMAANREAIFADPADYAGGNPDGDITLVEFMDYRCGYCRRAFPAVEELIETDGNIRFVVQEFPILGPESVAAARFAIATLQTRGADAYEAVHAALMSHRGAMDDAAFRAIAEGAGLDYAPIAARAGTDDVQAVIDDNMALAQSLGITGTPTFILEDRMIRGFLPLERMREAVAEQRAN